MTGTEDNEPNQLDNSDQGDVLAIVDEPESFRVPDRSWRRRGVVQLAAVAADVAAPAVPGLWGVPLHVLAATKATGAQQGKTRTPQVALMSVQDARKLTEQHLLTFPHGGPVVGDVYGRHPLRRSDYLPYADYHQLILHEKSIEAARYLLALGAQDVEITCHQTRGKDTKAEAGIKAPTVDDVTMTMGFGRDDTGKLAIRITGAGKRRRVPADLVWPNRDAMFTLAREAASSSAKTFHFGLRSDQSGMVNGRAALKLSKELGLGLGGEYKRWEELSLTVDASFGESAS